jgi:hypothetical protein
VFYSIVQTGEVDTDALSPNLGTMIFYSQVGGTLDAFSKCYSENDPTAEIASDPLATDGGFVTIPEMGSVVGMEALGNSLFVFATNGVWEIHGGEGSFSATSQSQSKVTNAGCLAPRSIIRGDGLLSYWSEGGIYTIELDKVSLRGVARNLSEGTIQSFYTGIPSGYKAFAAATYDEAARQVRWLYSDVTLPNPYLFNKELIFDVRLKAFYVNDIQTLTGASVPYVSGYATLSSIIFAEQSEAVTVTGDPVLAAGDPVVMTLRSIDADIPSSIKYLTSVFTGLTYEQTFSHYREPDFYDWLTEDGTGLDAPAFLLTGYWTGGVTTKEKSVLSMTTHMRRTEQGFTDGVGDGDSFSVVSPSGCLIQSQWQWTNSAGANRWGDTEQGYRLPRLYTPDTVSDPMDYGFTVVSTKNSLRGHGEALSLLFSSEEGKDCHIYGWSKEIYAENDT